jgi:hypothetical protein
MGILGIVKRPKESFSKGLSLSVFDDAYSPIQSDASFTVESIFVNADVSMNALQNAQMPNPRSVVTS